MSRCPYFFLVALLGMLASLGCGGAANPQPQPVGNYQVLAFSDLHFNPLYDASLYHALVAADPSQWAAIFQSSKITAPSKWGSDPNYPLLALALSAVKQRAAGSAVIVYTGDLVGHGLASMFYVLYYGKLDYPPPDQEAVAAMQAFIDKTVSFVTAQIRASAGDIPVVFAVGNTDSYASTGPDQTFLTQNAETFYTELAKGTVDQQGFLNSFTSGGYYSAEPLGPSWRVISLNTNVFTPAAPGNPDAELAWLDYELGEAQAAGQSVWLLLHVPLGANTQLTASNAAKAGTPGKVTESTTSMMLIPGYQTALLQILAKYPEVVTLSLSAHTHMDEYRVISPDVVLEGVPGISPIFGGNPAFKVFTITPNTLAATDYMSFSCDLQSPVPQFNRLYTFSVAYSMQGPLDSSLIELDALLVTSSTQQALYTLYFANGNTAVNPHTQARWNPINSVNWPIFACGISNMGQQEYMDCVNSY